MMMTREHDELLCQLSFDMKHALQTLPKSHVVYFNGNGRRPRMNQKYMIAFDIPYSL